MNRIGIASLALATVVGLLIVHSRAQATASLWCTSCLDDMYAKGGDLNACEGNCKTPDDLAYRVMLQQRKLAPAMPGCQAINGVPYFVDKITGQPYRLAFNKLLGTVELELVNAVPDSWTTPPPVLGSPVAAEGDIQKVP